MNNLFFKKNTANPNSTATTATAATNLHSVWLTNSIPTTTANNTATANPSTATSFYAAKLPIHDTLFPLLPSNANANGNKGHANNDVTNANAIHCHPSTQWNFDHPTALHHGN